MPDQPWQAAALYCRPSSADPACEAQRRALAAHVEEAGHGVHSTHEEPHAGAEMARGAVLDLARAGHIEAVLVARLSHWARSTPDLLDSVRLLRACNVVLHAVSGPRLDLGPRHGERVMAGLDAAIAIERELRRERAHRAEAAARAAGKSIGRRRGQRPKADGLAPEVLALAEQGLSRRAIAERLLLNPKTVAGILARAGAPA